MPMSKEFVFKNDIDTQFVKELIDPINIRAYLNSRSYIITDLDDIKFYYWYNYWECSDSYSDKSVYYNIRHYVSHLIVNMIKCGLLPDPLPKIVQKRIKNIFERNFKKVKDEVVRIATEIAIETYWTPIKEGARRIAIKKIMRNELYYCGLAKKLSMRDCGMF